jgi:putative glutathione S-transferase
MHAALTVPDQLIPMIAHTSLSQNLPSRHAFSSRLRLFNNRKHALTSICSQKESNDSSSKGGFRILEKTGKLFPQSALVKTAKFGWQQIWLTFMRELAPQSKDGDYKRPTYSFQHEIGGPDFPAENERYFLFLGNPCPWCHRVALALALRGLTNNITVIKAIDDPERASRGGWVFNSPEPAFGARDLREVYDACTADTGGYKGRCTAPLLVDKKTRRIVSNESAAIVRNLNEICFPSSSSGGVLEKSGREERWIDLYPEHLKAEIDALNEKIYDSINNGVYKSGFATTQEAYDAAQHALWSSLEKLDALLSSRRFLTGDYFTEADLRLFPTAVRFDAVYTVLFKCSARRWSDFTNLHAWLIDCAGLPLPVNADGSGGGTLADTVDVDDCRRSYFTQLFPLNPGGIVASGPTAVQLGLHGGQQQRQSSESRGSRLPSQVFYYMKPGK